MPRLSLDSERGTQLDRDRREALQDAADTQYLAYGEYDFEDLSARSEEIAGAYVSPEQVSNLARNYRWASRSKAIRRKIIAENARVMSRPLRDAGELAGEAAKTAAALKRISVACIGMAQRNMQALVMEMNEAERTGDSDKLTYLRTLLPTDPSGLAQFAAKCASLFEMAHGIESAAVSTADQHSKDPTQVGMGREISNALEALGADELASLVDRLMEQAKKREEEIDG